MALNQVKVQGGSALWIIPCVLVGGKLDDTFGTEVKFVAVAKHDIQFNMETAGSSDDSFVQIVLSHGYTLEHPQVTTAIDPSGNVKATAAGGGGGGSVDQVTTDIHENDYQFLIDLQSLKGDTVIVIVPLGNTNQQGFGYLIGKIKGDVTVSKSGNAGNAVSLNIQGGSSYELDAGVTGASFATALSAAVSSITQPGVAAASPSNPLDPDQVITTTAASLVTGDVANPGLLAGTWVFKKGA